MKKAAFALTTLAALAAAPAALAQDPPDDETQESSGAPVSTPAEASTTTITSTSAEPPIPVAPMAPPRARETIVARQKIRPHRPLLIAGTTTLFGSYVATAAVTAFASYEGRKADERLYLPVVGPWMHLADTTEGTMDMILVAGSGIAQGVGLGLTVLGVVIPEKIPAATIEALGTKVNLTATSFGRGFAGIGAVGQF
jgi:hypothetical protein